MKLSILIPSIPERFIKANRLYRKCLKQATDEVEILMFTDNKKRTIGEKRNDMLSLANGKYFIILDDDDDISKDFVKSILPFTDNLIDVITFKQECTIEGRKFIVEFGLGNDVEQLTQEYNDIKRPPWHCCVWNRERFAKVKFPEVNYGEDGVWAERAGWISTRGEHIDKVLHYYNFDIKKSAATTENNEVWKNPNV